MKHLAPCLLVAWLTLLAGLVHAHPLAPIGLELRESAPGTVAVTLTRPLVQPKGQRLVVDWPAGCVATAEGLDTSDDAVRERIGLTCDGPLAGRDLAVRGWGDGGAQVVLRVQLHDGRSHQAVLHPPAPATTIPPRPQVGSVLLSYGRLGVEHLLTGWDHLCFVLGLLLLVRSRWRVVAVLTAFTVGHSITLAAATLGWVAPPVAWVEIGIAASLLAVAVQAAQRRDDERFPVAVALAFGLLHGLGFAGALRETGLPEGAIPSALLGFNLGIEAGQLLVVALLLGAVALAHRAGLDHLGDRPRLGLAYAMGALASMWVFERAAAIVA